MNLKLGKGLKLILLALLFSVSGGSLFSLFIASLALMSGGGWEISTDLSSKVLTTLIELVGVLFGLSAIMMALFFDALRESTTELRRWCLVFSMVSFISFFGRFALHLA